ncbi:MAG: hypothetical protein C4524_04670 [Candidatus Zixiibacteriota bacterium]|nr:MAG: hypothetical protein C4524_04670 [candidate division Zixibacteria bacterium]
MGGFPASLVPAALAVDFRGSIALLALLILLAVAAAVLAYRRTTPPLPPGWRILLGTLRALAFLTLLFLIFEPSISLRRRQELPPKLAVILDDTQSMTLEDASQPRREQLRRLLDDPAWDALEERFELEVFAAGDSLRPLDGLEFDSLRLETIGTDLAGAWRQALRRPGGEEYAAVVLVSDGGDNAGRNPQQAAREAPVPLHAVGVGDTARVRDAAIASVTGGATAYRGKTASVTVRVKARDLAGQNATLELAGPDGRVLARQVLKLPPDDLETETTLSFTPDQVGTLPLNVRLTSPAAEWSTDNNARSYPLEVLESRIRVLALSGRPGFETMFFLRSAAAVPDVEIKALSLRPDGGVYGAGPEALAREMAQADVLVLLDFPRADSPAAARERLRRAYADQPLPVWAWTGARPYLEGLSDLTGELPFRADWAEAGPAEADPARFYAVLDPDAETSEAGLWEDLPPLLAPEAVVQAGGEAQALVTLKDPATGAARGPAVLAWEAQGRRHLASFGSGYWKWSFLTVGLEGSDELYRSFLGKALRWLAAGPQSQPLRVDTDRNLYSAGEAVRFDARVLGGGDTPVTSAQVEVTLQGPEGPVKVVLEPNAAGQYSGRFQPGAVGTYAWQGLAQVDGDTAGADSGRFMVEAYNVEKETLGQNRELLQAIASAGGGAYVPADSLAALAASLQAPPREVTTGWDRRFFLNWDLWIILLGLLTAEWIIRKRLGML